MSLFMHSSRKLFLPVRDLISSRNVCRPVPGSDDSVGGSCGGEGKGIGKEGEEKGAETVGQKARSSG